MYRMADPAILVPGLPEKIRPGCNRESTFLSVFVYDVTIENKSYREFKTITSNKTVYVVKFGQQNGVISALLRKVNCLNNLRMTF